MKKQRKFILEGLRIAMANIFLWHKHEYFTQVISMPQVWPTYSSTNGKGRIFLENVAHKCFYTKRFIDDILTVWKGDQEKLNEFMEDVGAKKYGINSL